MENKNADSIPAHNNQGATGNNKTNYYKAFFNSSSEGFCIIELSLNSKGKITDLIVKEVNEAFIRHSGLHNVTGKSVKDFLPEHEQQWIDVYRKVHDTGVPGHAENYIKDIDRWFSINVIRLDDTSIPHVAVIFRDITKRKKAGHAMHESDRRKAYMLQLTDVLRLLTDPAEIQQQALIILGEYLKLDRAVIYEIDADLKSYSTHVSYLRRGFMPHLSHFKSRLSQNSVSNFQEGTINVIDNIEKDSGLTHHEKSVYRAMDVGSCVSAPLIRNGQWVWNLVVHYSDPRHWTPFELAIIEETSERIWEAKERAHLEQMMLKSDSKLAAIFADAAVGLSIINARGEFLMVNNTLCKLLGSTREELLHLGVAGVTAPEYLPTSFEALKKVLETGEPVALEKEYIRPDKSRIYAESIISLLRDNDTDSEQLIVVTADLTARKQAENALRDKEESLRAVTELVPALLWEADTKGYEITHTKRWSDYTGQTTEETQNWGWLEAIHPADLKRVTKIFTRAFATGKGVQTEQRIRSANGEYRWFQVHHNPYVDSNGRVLKWFGAALDIHNSKTTAQALKQSEEKYRSLFENIDEAFAVLELERDTEGNINDIVYTEANKAFGLHTGWKDAIGKKASKLLPNLEQVFYNTLQKVADTGIQVRMEEYVADLNRWFDVLYSRIGGEGSKYISAIFKDVTKEVNSKIALQEHRQWLEKEVSERTTELQEQRELLQATLDSTVEMIQVFKAERKNNEIVDFIWVLNNKTSEEHYGNVIGQSLLKNNPGVVQEGIFKNFKEVVETGLPQQFEKHYVHEQFDAWFYMSVVKLDDGVVAFTANINERKKAEQAVAKLNNELMAKNRELSSLNTEINTFNNIASGDYKETLQTLYMYLEHIVKTDARNMTDSGKSNLRRAQSSIQKLKLLTQDIIDFSKVKYIDPDFKNVSLHESLTGAIADLQDKITESNAVISIPEPLPEVSGFPLLIAIMFHHLLDNAIKFVNPGTKPQVTITWEKAHAHTIHHRLPDTHYYKICIADNGIGFPEKEAEKIFTIFYRLHEKRVYKGSGIGLAVCKKIMELHHGFILAKNNPGGGAVFCCCFPAD